MTSADYEEVSDDSMDQLHENLEILCEQYGPNDWEVEYSVYPRFKFLGSLNKNRLIYLYVVWSNDIACPTTWNICDQQTTT